MNPYEQSIRELTLSIEGEQEKIAQLRAEAENRQKQLDGKIIARDVLQKVLARANAEQRTQIRAANPFKLPSGVVLKTAEQMMAEIEAGVTESSGRVIDSIKIAIRSLGTTRFTVREVEHKLESMGRPINGVQPRARISAFLKDLTNDGFITLVQEGSGGIPNIYRLTSLMTAEELKAIKSPGPLTTGLGI